MRFDLAILLPLVLLAGVGCVERRLLIRTEPPAEHVTVDGETIAPEPSSAPGDPRVLRFEHYGYRRVTARAPGRVPKETLVTLDPPWWQVFPIDFVTDVLVPWTIEDEREVALALEERPRPVRADAEAAERRARELAAESERRPP